jgi:carbon monoxide dehydrogenase subunit G
VKLEGERSYSAPRETVWQVLNDPVRMAELMPGVESFDVQDDRHWVARVKVPLGLGAIRMSINFDRLEQREPEYSRLAAKGTGVGALMNMETSFHLEEQDGGTAMRWEADVHIAGPVGAMGQRVLQPIVNQQVSQVLTALDKEVQRAARDGPTAPSSELLDAGPPAEPRPEADPAEEAGSSGADEGVSPLSPETYDEDPEGPTTSTEDRS